MISETVLKFDFSGPKLTVSLLSTIGSEIAVGEVFPEALDEVFRTSREFVARPSLGQATALGDLIARYFLTPAAQVGLQLEAKRELEAGGRLRVTIAYDDQTLDQVPWELLRLTPSTCHDPLNGFIALNPRVSICRRIPQAESHRLSLPSPLRLLVISSDPRTDQFPALAWIEAEVRAISAAFARATSAEVRVRQVFDATPVVIERTLRSFNPHIVHFSGHGDARPPDGALILQGATAGSMTPLTASEAGKMFFRSGVSLVVLAACHSGGALNRTAQSIHGAGVATVVAMQAAIHDSWQPQFARTFYGALADGASVDEALSEARNVLAPMADRWAAPVLYACRGVQNFVAHRPALDDRSGSHNLVRPHGAFIGREHDQGQIMRLLRSSVSRLVTICGTGGVGKSRLAVEVGRRILSAFPDGVWRIDCEAIRNADDLMAAIATVLGIQRGGLSLGESLRNAHVLLILDGLEALAATGANEPISRLLGEAGSVAMLVTSRVRLGLDAEIVWHLRPLSHASVGGEADSSSALFLSAASHNGISLLEEDRSLVCEICSDLEGLPLAILLAVGRLRYIGLSDLRSLLRRSQIKTLQDGGVNGKRSGIGGAISRSLEIAPASDLVALRRLCVFLGSFTLADVATVLKQDSFEALDSLQKLVDQSLLESAASSLGNRFFVLEAIREYVTSALPRDISEIDLGTERLRHAHHFATRAEEIAESMRDGKWEVAMQYLWNSLGNLRTAIQYSSNAGLDDLVLKFGHGLAVTLMEAGYWSDFADLAATAYRSAARLEDSALTTRLLGLEGAMEARLGNVRRCKELWLRRADECLRVGDDVGASDTLLDLAIQAYQAGDGPECIVLLDQAEPLLEKSGRPDLSATLLTVRALLAVMSNDLGQAIRQAEAARHLANVADRHDTLLFVHTNLGRVWQACGDPQRAMAELVYAVRGSQRADRKVQLGVALSELASVHETLGQLESAYICLAAAHGIYAEIGSRRGPAADARLTQFKQKFGSEPVALGFDELCAMGWSRLTREALLRSDPDC